MRALSYANRGLALEEIIETANSRYAEKEIAVIDKQHTKWLPIRDSKTGKIASAKVERKATVDFRGTVKGLGGVSFDVKETSSDRWYLRELQPHQVEHLQKCQAVGDYCFVLIAFWKYNSFSILSFEEYKMLVNEGIKSIRHDSLPAISMGKIWQYLDYI